jgi:hypothetical protein
MAGSVVFILFLQHFPELKLYPHNAKFVGLEDAHGLINAYPTVKAMPNFGGFVVVVHSHIARLFYSGKTVPL